MRVRTAGLQLADTMDESKNQTWVALLRDTAAGDTTAFERLYDDTSSYLYAVAIKIVRTRTTADDVLQDAFVQVWHRAGDYHVERGTVLAWLTTIVRYRAIDVLRKQRNDTSLDDGSMDHTISLFERLDTDGNPDSVDGGPAASAIADEDLDFVNTCLSRLSGAQQQSVVLAFFHGLTHRELAQRLALPLGTIKSRLRRSLQRLKQCLGELGYRDEIPT